MAAKTRIFKPSPATNRSPLPSDRTAVQQPAKVKPDPYKSVNTEALLKHIKERLDGCNIPRGALISRLRDIDVELSGFVTMDKEDKKRDQDNKQGLAPKAIKMNLPLAMAQLDEVQTYLLSVFAPEGDLFEAVAPPTQQDMAKALARYINQNGTKVGYYNQFGKFLTNALRYNFGAMGVTWETQSGIVWSNDSVGQAQKNSGVVWSGNVLRSMDMYNFLWDTTVHPTELATKGEYYAYVEKKTPFRVRKMEQDQMIFNVDEYIKTIADTGNTYYRTKPELRNRSSRDSRSQTQDFATALIAGDMPLDSSPGIEFVYFVGWITPKEFNLSESKDLEVWIIVMANSRTITRAFRLEDSAGVLPIGVACPIVDDLDNDQRTYAEQLIPLGHFSSFLLNSHVSATRKSLYGLKIYNQNLFPGLDKSQSDMESAYIPMKSTANAIDIDKAFRVYNDAPKTEQNVADIAKVEAIMQKILPSDMLGQVADLDRATLYQAAATVQASNRRSLKIARVIMSQALQVIKLLMIYNIYSSQEPVSVTMPDGTQQDINPSQLRESKLELEMAGGLKGLDRLMVAQVARDILMAILQSQQAMAEIDVVKFIDYYTSVAGDKTDMTAFRRQAPAPAIPGQAAPGQSPVTPGGPEQAPILKAVQ